MKFVIKKKTSGHSICRSCSMLYQFFLFLLLVQCIKCEETDEKPNERTLTSLEKLRLQLFTNYDKNSQPLHNNARTNITLGMSVNYIDIDELNGKVTLHCWLRVRWSDDNRSWNATEYNINQIHLKAKEVWKPDVQLFNSAGEGNYLGDTQVILLSDGSLLWVPPALYTAYCSLNLALWPYDTQTCKLKIGSYSLTHIDSVASKVSDNLDYSDLVQSTEWAIIDASMSYQMKTYYNYIEYTFRLQRRSTMYTAVIYTPASCVVILALATFWLPPHMGEKIMLNGITIVIIAAFLMYFANLLPILANNVPLIVLFYSASLLLVSISTAISVMVLYFATSKQKRRVPEYIKKLINGRVGKFLLLSHFTLEADSPVYEDPDSSTDPFGVTTEPIPTNRAIQFDWVLLASAIDRISFLIYCLIFIILAIVFSV